MNRTQATIEKCLSEIPSTALSENGFAALLQHCLNDLDLDALDKLFDLPGERSQSIDFLELLRTRYAQVEKLHLDKEVSISTLQLGGEDAVFSFICKFFGHEAFAVLPIISDPASQRKREQGLVPQRALQIPFQFYNFDENALLPSFGKKFDIIAAFSFDSNRSTEWDADRWQLFLDDIFSHCRGVNGRIYIETAEKPEGVVEDFDTSKFVRVVESSDIQLTLQDGALTYGSFEAPVRSTTQKAKPAEDTRTQLEKFIEENKDAEKGFAKELVALVEYALQAIDLDEYERVKSYHFSEGSPTRPNKRKYFDLLYYLKGKLRVATNLELHKQSGLHVLDIGTGVGHLPFICKRYGHQVVCTDIPDNTTEGGFKSADELSKWTNFPTERRSIYRDLLALLQVERIDHRIEAFTPLPDFGLRFDRITALMISFDKYFVEQTLWGFDEWDFLLNDIKSNQLNEDGIIYFQMNRSAHYKGLHFDAPEFIKFFEARGCKVNVEKSLVTFGYEK